MKPTAIAWAVTPILFLLLGCALPRPSYTPVRTFTIDTSVILEPVEEPLGEVLGVRRFAAPARYRHNMVSRLSDVEAQTYEYHRWIEMPEEMLSQAYLSALRSARVFEVVEPVAALRRPPYVLDGDVLRFEEARIDGKWYAVCELYLRLVDAQDDMVVWRHRVIAQEPMETINADGLARAMNDAVRRCVQESVDALMEAGLPSR